MRRALAASLWLLPLPACDGAAACTEDARAQRLDAHVSLTIDGVPLVAELADTDVARERGWRYRRCDREALLLRHDPGSAAAPLPVWGCALVDPIDVAFIADGRIVRWHAGLEPCDRCDASCPIVGDDLEVDGVLELDAGAWEFAVGDTVIGP